MAKKQNRTVIVGWSDALDAWLAWTPRGLHYIRNIPAFSLIDLDRGRQYHGVEVTS